MVGIDGLSCICRSSIIMRLVSLPENPFHYFLHGGSSFYFETCPIMIARHAFSKEQIGLEYVERTILRQFLLV